MNINYNLVVIELPDRDYYLVDNERFADIRKAFVDHVAQMMAFTGLSNDDAQRVLKMSLSLKPPLLRFNGHVKTSQS